ncbi:PorP/SprF family type IX secretion system membrane protein [Chryseolinea lacunae]|uniref:Type IX secretion system membrane protein PorP/SprF n=1 Tax=Chryseolinea lacunae TaxID=2801331 RepID=A0ABS1KUZ8_9BACT|nr:type IX secretion system membrane protein PorP/SprF [Chryseolinea lacunae]MBL0742146.1 type IX secretion system membrane protein PorP/SprF [Chryseolinea lacunae]
MLKRTFYTLSLLLLGAGAFAQQDPLFTQYMFNNLYMTPAFAGVDGVTRFSAIHRSQWLGYQSSFGDGGAPTTQMVTFNTPINKLRSGAGAYIINDNLGPQNNLEAQVSYAYHLGIKDTKLSFGIKAGVYSQTINGKHYRFVQENDPLIIEGKESQIKPDLGLGVFYRAEKYYLGMGFNHLLRSNFNFGLDSVRGALVNHINFTGGYFYEVSFDLKVQFTTAVRTDLNKTQVDLAGIAYIKDTMWGGLAFRQAEAASLLLGYSLLKDKSLKMGTAIDFIVKDRAAKESFSFEFMLSYDLPVNPGSGKKVVRTPRYRH